MQDAQHNHPAFRYLLHNNVEGWLTHSAGALLLALAEEIDVRDRPVCEIGVHHGKFLLFLGLLTGGRVVGYDLFERQEENTDNSGRGDLEALRSNVHHYLGGSDRFQAVTSNSLDLCARQVVRDCGDPPVFFSVDGGHTRELTMNDLEIAAHAISADGVVIVDDVFNEGWPEVAEGFFDFLSESSTLVPFCAAGNKVFLASSREHADRLRRSLVNLPSGTLIGLRRGSIRNMRGTEICVFSKARTSSFLGALRSKDWFLRFKYSRVGQSVRSLRERLKNLAL